MESEAVPSHTETPTYTARDRAEAAFAELVAENDRLQMEVNRLTEQAVKNATEIGNLRTILTELYKAYGTCPVCYGDSGRHIGECAWVMAVLNSPESL